MTLSVDQENTDDMALISAIAAGHRDSFEVFYRRHRNTVYRFAWAMSRSVPVAEDATQDTFVMVIEHASRFDRKRGQVLSWLFGCARNKVVDRLRHLPVDDSAVETVESGELHSTDVETDADRMSQRLHRAVTFLPLPFREVIVLCDLQEFSYADAAVILDCPVGTVRSRLARGRLQLRRWLDRESENGKTSSGQTATLQLSGAQVR